MKRILIVTQYIYPEPFKSTEMAFELAKRGYKVDVLTGIPNYPEGHYYNGYGLFSKRCEMVNDVTFYRCLQTPRKLLPGFIGLSLNYFSFAISASLWVLFFFVWKKKYFAIITHEPSPITQIIPACILGILRKVPVYSWIQDIWPDSGTSSLKGKHIIIESVLTSITEWVYRHSCKILYTSPGMAKLINRNNNYNDKLIYYPQWSEDYLSDAQRTTLRDSLSIPANHGIFMMAGNIGRGIGVDAVLSLCAELDKTNMVSVVFVGSGSEENMMRDYIRNNNIKHTFFIGRKPSSELADLYSQADAMLLSLAKTDSPHLKATIPARLQGYMSSGKPVYAMIDGDAADLISLSDCGYVVRSGDYNSLAEIICRTILADKLMLGMKGENGRKYFEKHFVKDDCIDLLVQIIS